ncbi:heat-shock protein [Burkholderia ubonensis]|uniref:Hsp20/alpha crystallin family protein n=1 Tax=Burkholderia ubonensis TaxID=101571 RepID=UPI00075D0AE8|nr:Hsp20/alpha crystallin family protein [Burkholderia ubonensis]KVO69598.1 heat-shock protein [Burkholderia ubonensis]KVP20195.1 heat-shock protein [Burkholderia ubonensis]KVP86326.1 heat-shock protein [Burkholderia ubonensis]KVQ03394.1 heat-shock protein [Burkholderia ubonensis]KVQ99897.1 heat-shock protein [Burkholderia ubonensis]
MNISQPVTERQSANVQPSAAAARAPAIAPAVDIVEDRRGVTLRADLPGVPRENLDVKVHDNTLSIDAQVHIDLPTELRVRHAELRAPRFARAFTLSPDLDTSNIVANLRDGVLTLTIPRREAAQPRRIEVAAGNA